MKISEASELGGVTPSTMKYYLRESLVHEGERIGANQTSYDESHVRRVRLVRALIETGGLSIAAAKEVLSTLDSEETSLAHTFEAAQHALGVGGATTGLGSEEARQTIVDLVGHHAWATSDDNPGLEIAARVLDGFATIGLTPPEDYLRAYASAAATIARADLEILTTRTRPEEIAELMVVGTVLGDTLLAGLRRLAQEHMTTEFFPTGSVVGDKTEAGR